MAHFEAEFAPPDEIDCNNQVFDLHFHPSMPIVASALINGETRLYRYSTVNSIPNQLVLRLNNHSSSCRGVRFDPSGQALYTISSDRSIATVNAEGALINKRTDAHSEAINKLTVLSENIFATGDDGGSVKVWDARQSSHVHSYKLHEDFVSDFTYNSDANVLISVGGDSCLCAYDLRSRADNSRKSDEQEAELQCVEVIKGGRKVVSGTQDGVLVIFSWGRWGDCSDRFPGHPESVDCLLKIDESTLITGSSDGLIRVVQLQPNAVLGVLGDHEKFPVEGAQKSFDGNILCTYAHDSILRFWDISMFSNDEPDEDESGGMAVPASHPSGIDDVDPTEPEPIARTKPKRRPVKSKTARGSDSEDMDEEGEDWDEGSEEGSAMSEDEEEDDDGSDSSSDEEPQTAVAKSRKMPTASEKFFADL
jgi:WD40 repeat protein